MADPVSLGLTIALTGLQMGLQAMRKIEGPRLTDLKFSGGDPSAPLNYFYGTRRFAGIPIFFAEDIKEKKKKRKTKGGKYNDYTYYGTFAAVIADHEIDAVTRIWLDKHLVYDATGTGPMYAATSDGADNEPLLSLSAYLRIYLGTDTQDPDPRMLATIEDRHGVGSCPAYRRIAYLMFEELPLEKVGNRIPQISVEATDGATPNYPGEIHDNTLGLLAFDFAPSFSYFVLATGSALHVWNTPTRELISTVTMPASISNESVGLTGEGTFFATAGSVFSPDLWLMNIDGGGTQLVSGITEFCDGCTYVDGNCYIYPYLYILPRIMALSGTSVTVVSEAFIPTHYFPDENGDAWAVGKIDAENKVCFYKMEGGELHEVASASGGNVCAFDNGQGQFVIWQDDYVKLVDKDTWTITDAAAATAVFIEQRRRMEATPPGSPKFWGNRFSEFSSTTLDVIRTVTPTDWGLGDTVSQTVYDPINNALICADGTHNKLNWRFLDRIGGNGVTLATITADICDKCGIDAADIDVTALTDTIDGYSYTQGQGSQILEPLMDLYQALPRPHDFDLQFIKRGGSSAGTIDVSEFTDNKPRYKVDPKLDNDLPAVVSLTFADPDADQQPNQVDSPRRKGTTEGQSQASYDMGTLVLNVDDAYNLVTRYHRGLWNRNEAIENGVTSDYTKLEPGDVWNLALDDETRTACLTKLTFSGTELKCEWEKDFAQLATLPDLTGAPADGHEPSVIFMPVQSRALVLDIPLLNDSDNQDNPLLYIGAAPFGSGMWPGAVIYQDDGTGDYPLELGTIDSAHAATWGTTTNALADADYTVWDRGNSFNVQLRNGDVPASATEAACNANPRLNRFALGNDGRWEVGQFTTATLEIDGTVTFSGLKRGRRGSEWATDSHAVGDIFVLTETLVPVEMGAGDIGDTISFKAGTSGLDPDDAIPVSVGYDGQSNMPWAPAQFDAIKNYSTGDWVFTWRRRSRIAGDWATGTPPLGESTENYKLKIYDSMGAVVRTLTPTSETATWTVAQQTTDFGGERWSSVPAGVLQVGDLADGFETQDTFHGVAPPSSLVYVGGAKGNGASASTITVSLTSLTGGIASAPSAGDIVLIGWAVPNSGAVTPAVTGYTAIENIQSPGAGVDTWLGAFYKVLSGADTTADLSATGNAAYQGSYTIQVWRNQGGTPVGVSETAIGTSTDPNPPAINPALERSIIVCVGANGSDASNNPVPAITQPSAEMTYFVSQASAAGGVACAMGALFWDGVGEFDPAVWDGGTGFTWAAVSFELRSS